MLEHLSRRLEEAQARLRAALVTGQPTDTHRQAIVQIERDIEREREEQDQTDAERAQRRASTIAKCAATIANQSCQRIAALVAAFPIPSEH
jgi:hypothetical protein